MSTDCNATIELMVAPPGMVVPLPWATVSFSRDYLLFDLMAGGRSGDPSDAVVPVRESVVSTWLLLSELEIVAGAYRQRKGRDCVELLAVIAAMKILSGDAPNLTRLTLTFF